MRGGSCFCVSFTSNRAGKRGGETGKWVRGGRGEYQWQEIMWCPGEGLAS